MIYGGKQFQIKNALPFASLERSARADRKGTDRLPAEDGARRRCSCSRFGGRDDPIPMVSGIDARLIEAEAKLNANDIAGMMTILNALRAAPPEDRQLPAGDDGGAADAGDARTPRSRLFFREKAFWMFGRGQRLSDLRRLMRQYGRTEDKVFPGAASSTKAGTYGTRRRLPGSGSLSASIRSSRVASTKKRVTARDA